jgi:hypothetical protein
MKKLFVTLFALVSAGSAFAAGYQINMTNKSDGVVEVAIDYLGAGVCAPDKISIRPGNTKKLEVGICCTKSVTVKGMSGSIKGQMRDYQPPRTGARVSCRGFDFTVSSVDGQLIFE